MLDSNQRRRHFENYFYEGYKEQKNLSFLSPVIILTTLTISVVIAFISSVLFFM